MKKLEQRRQFGLKNPGPFLYDVLALLRPPIAVAAPATESCLSEVTIAQLVDGSASRAEIAAADKHLGSCSRCCDLLNLLMQAHMLNAEPGCCCKDFRNARDPLSGRAPVRTNGRGPRG